MIKEFDGRTIIGATMRLVGAGDGLSQAQRLKGELPNYQIGDRTVVVHEVELIKIGVEPATKDDLDGDLNVVLTWRALNGLPTDAPAVRKLLQQHSKRLAEAKELEKTLARYGAHAFLSGWDQQRAMVEFLIEERRVRFILPLPDRNSEEFQLTPAGRRRRSDEDATRAWEQACRQAWRALNLVVKAKLEAVDAGITTFEAEFLAHLVLPGGQTIGDTVLPQLNELGPSGPLLALGTGKR